MKKALSFLLVLTLLLSAVYAFPFEQASAQEEDTTLKTDTYIPEEEYTEEIYEGTGSLEYAFDGTFIRDYVDNETLDEAGHVARINEEEALNTYVFLNRDGTKSVYYMDDNVRYVDENGETVEKDLTIIRKNKGYTLKANDVKLWFPDVLSDGISVKYDKFHLTLYPQGVADTEEVIIDEYERITYPGVFGENTVLAYTPTLSGLKEDIILSEYTGQLSYDFLIHTHGMRILEQDGKYIVKKPGNGNKETFELGAVQIYDSAGNFCVGEMKITEQNNGSKYILTLIAPEEFLTDPDTVYPVTIDPSITVSDNLNGANAIEDSVIYSGTPNSNYGGFTYLTVGYGDSTYGVGRAIFRLPGLYNSDLYNSLSASQITSVKFYTWDASGHDNLPINVLANVNIPWTESGVKWNNAPGGYPGLSPVTANMPSGNFACFDITSIVEWWKAGNSPAGGFTMKNPNETSDLYKKVPCSSETAITDRRPYVVMTYAPDISLSSSLVNLQRGHTCQLTVSTSSNAIVTWASNSPSTASVSNTGLVTGINAGGATITATITESDGTSSTASCSVYVIIPSGIYSVESAQLPYRIELYNLNSYQSGMPLSVWNTGGSAPTQRNSFFKITHIGGGLYSIRSMVNSTMGWTRNGTTLVCSDIGTSETNVPTEAKWYILSDSNGYTITNRYGSSYTISHPSTVTTSADVIYKSHSKTDMTQHWELTKLSGSYSGVEIRNEISTLVMGSTHRFVATMYSSVSYVNGQNGITWSVTNGTGSATIDSNTGVLTGISPGTVIVTVTYPYPYTPSTYWTDDCVVLICALNDVKSMKFTRDPSDTFTLCIVTLYNNEKYWYQLADTGESSNILLISESNIDLLEEAYNSHIENGSNPFSTEYCVYLAKVKVDAKIAEGELYPVPESSDEYNGLWLHFSLREIQYRGAIALAVEGLNTFTTLLSAANQAYILSLNIQLLANATATHTAVQYFSAITAAEAFDTITDVQAVNLGITDIVPANNYVGARPTWRQSELFLSYSRFTYELGYTCNKAYEFRDGNLFETTYGAANSIRPDFYNKTTKHFVEVKNYTITTANGRNSLVYNVVNQYNDRLNKLPSGTTYEVFIDVRGQAWTQAMLDNIYDRITQQTNGEIIVNFIK
ncbi:MAG: DNRLRE domain-containing protein [Clostridia bacterium]|nr:DNRLRE domain-containing protein [Clostridia bacterium]